MRTRSNRLPIQMLDASDEETEPDNSDSSVYDTETDNDSEVDIERLSAYDEETEIDSDNYDLRNYNHIWDEDTEIDSDNPDLKNYKSVYDEDTEIDSDNPDLKNDKVIDDDTNIESNHSDLIQNVSNKNKNEMHDSKQNVNNQNSTIESQSCNSKKDLEDQNTNIENKILDSKMVLIDQKSTVKDKSHNLKQVLKDQNFNVDDKIFDSKQDVKNENANVESKISDSKNDLKDQKSNVEDKILDSKQDNYTYLSAIKLDNKKLDELWEQFISGSFKNASETKKDESAAMPKVIDSTPQTDVAKEKLNENKQTVKIISENENMNVAKNLNAKPESNLTKSSDKNYVPSQNVSAPDSDVEVKKLKPDNDRITYSKTPLKMLDDKKLDELWEQFISGSFKNTSETKIDEPSVIPKVIDSTRQTSVEADEKFNPQQQNVEIVSDKKDNSISETDAAEEITNKEMVEKIPEDENLIKNLNAKPESDSDESDDEDYIPDQKDDTSGEDSEPDVELSESKKDDTMNTKWPVKKLDEKELDKLWEQFTSGNFKKASEEKKTESIVVQKEYDFAGETIVVNKEVKPPEQNVSEKGNIPKRKQPIKELLASMKKPKISTLQKTIFDWKDFKEENNLEAELAENRKSKNSYLNKQAFLDRTDMREFEKEKELREKERMRNLKK